MNKVTKIPMTLCGAEKLREELKQLKSVTRQTIINAIAEAREHGDLKENAEYHAAREQQSFVEGRIKEIESKLSNSHIIDVTTLENDGKIIFGSTIEIVNLDNNETVIYKLVGDDEADLKNGKVSINSPIARALIGKFEGDVVEVSTPGGRVSYEIAKVTYV
jgi:transcription elongation factor GreA